MVYHLYSEHAPDGCLPTSLDIHIWCDMFITKQEEDSMGIEEARTEAFREQYRIPDSDDLPLPADVQTEASKRPRSDSTSTMVSSKGKQRARCEEPSIEEQVYDLCEA
jgi:hypothetical protein